MSVDSIELRRPRGYISLVTTALGGLVFAGLDQYLLSKYGVPSNTLGAAIAGSTLGGLAGLAYVSRRQRNSENENGD